MATVALMLAGALAWIKRSEEGFTESNIDDVLIIGVIFDFAFVAIGIALAYLPVIGDLQTFFPTIRLTLNQGTLTLLGGQLIFGYINYLLGAFIPAVIDELSKLF